MIGVINIRRIILRITVIRFVDKKDKYNELDHFSVSNKNAKMCLLLLFHLIKMPKNEIVEMGIHSDTFKEVKKQ